MKHNRPGNCKSRCTDMGGVCVWAPVVELCFNQWLSRCQYCGSMVYRDRTYGANQYNQLSLE